MTCGPIRKLVDQIRAMSRFSGLEMEQCADMLDYIARIDEPTPSTEDATTLENMQPAKGKH